MSTFNLVSDYQPLGDQPQAIATLTRRLREGAQRLTLEGVTGSGKTFTLANVIQQIGVPTLVISHNKTLAAQLFAEFKSFFPHNAVEYFVSYYDYYQPEAYIPQTDTYIEKDSAINEEIERLRLSATNSLLSRQDVIIVASVSCIYGLGSPQDYETMLVKVAAGDTVDRDVMLRKLVDIQYKRNDIERLPGTFRVRGDTVEIFPSYSQTGIRAVFFGDEIESVVEIDTVTGNTLRALHDTYVSPAKHFVMPESKIAPAIDRIRDELKDRLAVFEQTGRLLEAQRLQQRTRYDLEMLVALGYCSGIENYSRHLSGRAAGEPPATLLDYFKGNFLTVIDESHVTLPQIRGMYNGDQARKSVLVEHGFRLPSAKDNRPLNFDEFLKAVGPIVFTSATPGPYELQQGGTPVLQVIRPTGLIDPPIEIRPLGNQIDDLMEEVRAHAERHERVLVTTLTKRSAEDLSEYLTKAGLKSEYLHSEIDAIERVEVLRRLRKGDFDCLIGVNLLREGLDLPEVALVAILDADKEGFLRSTSSLIQVAGRTARHVKGRVILYADIVTDSMRTMMNVTEQRRVRQLKYNEDNHITPTSIQKSIREGLVIELQAQDINARIVREEGVEYDVGQTIADLEQEMMDAASSLEFERAAMLRDEVEELKRAAGVGRPSSGKKSKSPSSGEALYSWKPDKTGYSKSKRPKKY